MLVKKISRFGWKIPKENKRLPERLVEERGKLCEKEELDRASFLIIIICFSTLCFPWVRLNFAAYPGTQSKSVAEQKHFSFVCLHRLMDREIWKRAKNNKTLVVQYCLWVLHKKNVWKEKPFVTFKLSDHKNDGVQEKQSQEMINRTKRQFFRWISSNA